MSAAWSLWLLVSAAPDAPALADWGLATLRQIRSELYLPERHLYADQPGQGPAFLWGAGVQLSALVAAARWSPELRPWLDEYTAALDAYWNPAGPTPGYDCLPVPKPVDRYYDDNVWLALAWLEAYDAFADPVFLDRAKRTMTYVLSGWDEQLGGGIYWRESDKKSKNTCINAPAAVACLKLAELGETSYAARGHELLAWTVEHLYDERDALFFDHVAVADGKVTDWKFSYNVALPIRAWLAAARLSAGDEREAYLQQARRTADAGLAKWRLPDGTFWDALRFDHLFADALLELSAQTGDPQYRDAVLQGAARLRELGPDPDGHYPGKLGKSGQPTAALEKWSLIDQASAARWYLSAALATRP